MTHDYMCLAYSRDNWTENKNTGNAGIYVAAEFCLEAKEEYIEQEVGHVCYDYDGNLLRDIQKPES